MSDTFRPRSKVAFLHVPKCGGVSVESQLRKCFAPSEVIPLYFPHEYKDIKDQTKLEAFSLIIGHFDHDVIALLGPTYVKAILVREPLSLVVSLYNHAASRPKHALHETILAGQMPFIKFCGRVAGTKNILAKYLLGRGTFAQLAAQRPLNQAVRNVVKIAKQHLSHFDCIGMLDEMDRFHRLLSYAIGINLDPFKKSNSSPQTISVDDLTREERSMFESANAFDIEVYEAVRGHYESSRVGQRCIDNGATPTMAG